MTRRLSIRKSAVRQMICPALVLLAALAGPPATAQDLPERQDDLIPPKLESVYKRGLEYLSKTQSAKGAWEDGVGAEPAVVGLAVVAFLAHGEDANQGPYAKNIRMGIDYILAQQNQANGYIGNSMYNHGFATLALAESYGMVDNPKIAPALRKAVDLIISAQKHNPFGGWRYTPEDRLADTTCSGCQLVALFAARNAGLAIPDSTFKGGLSFLSRCRGEDGAYGYTNAIGGRVTLTAVGSLCQSLARERESKGYKASVEYLKGHMDYRERTYPFYYEYYMSQALFQADQEAWRKWNARNIEYLAVSQGADGSWPGGMGASFNTSAALLSLALNYRFLPIYEK
jgi:hypothetical protein